MNQILWSKSPFCLEEDRNILGYYSRISRQDPVEELPVKSSPSELAVKLCLGAAVGTTGTGALQFLNDWLSYWQVCSLLLFSIDLLMAPAEWVSYCRRVLRIVSNAKQRQNMYLGTWDRLTAGIKQLNFVNEMLDRICEFAFNYRFKIRRANTVEIVSTLSYKYHFGKHKFTYSCKIWGSHGGDYEEWRLLECCGAWLL
jgi:hypothetical protein